MGSKSADSISAVSAYESVATMSVSAVERIDKWVADTKADIRQKLVERDVLGQRDFVGNDMGQEVLDQAYRAIEAQASRQRAEVIDMAKSDLKALSGHLEPQGEGGTQE